MHDTHRHVKASHTPVSWTNAAGGDWATASNWSNGAVPNSNDAVTINTASLQTITHSTGSDTVYSLAVGNDLFDLSGGSLLILSKASFANGFTQTGGTFNGGSVTIKGTGTLIGGGSTGTTTLTVSGTTALANYVLGGSSVLKGAKTINQTGAITLGDNTGVGATISNAHGALYAIAGDYGVNGGAASASIVNAGTLEKSAGNGTSAIDTTVTSTGTLNVVSGDLQLNGPSNVIGGLIEGAGALSFSGTGNTTLTLGTTTLGTLGLFGAAELSLAGTTSTLNGALLDESSGTDTLALGAGSLAVNGAAVFAGSFGQAYVSGTGSLVLAGATTASQAQFGGQLTVVNDGDVSETGSVYLGDGNNGIVTFDNAASGTYQLTTNDGISYLGTTSSIFDNEGLFTKTGGTGTSQISTQFSNAAGATLNVGSATVLFTNVLANAGTIAGTGQLAIQGTAILSAGTVLAVAQIDVNNQATLTLAASLTYGGILADVSNGSDDIALGANTLTLTGSQNTIGGSFGSANLSGTGELLNAAGGTLTVAQAVIGGSVLFDNLGSVLQTGPLTIGDSSGQRATLANARGATWSLVAATTLANQTTTTGSFTNAGTFDVLAGTGTAVVTTNFTNSAGATITIQSGSLQDTGVLSNTGTITGRDFAIGQNGQATLGSGSKVSTASFDLYGNTTLNLTASQTYAGTFNDSSSTDTINLAANSLSLTGPASFIGSFGTSNVVGSGTLTTSGATSLANVLIGGTADFRNSGTLQATGQLQIGDGSANAATFTNAATGLYDLVNDGANIVHGGSLLSDFINAGLFEKTIGTGTTVINTAFDNTGTITVTSGTIEFTAGSLTNNGTINGVVSTDQNGNVFITHT